MFDPPTGSQNCFCCIIEARKSRKLTDSDRRNFSVSANCLEKPLKNFQWMLYLPFKNQHLEEWQRSTWIHTKTSSAIHIALSNLIMEIFCDIYCVSLSNTQQKCHVTSNPHPGESNKYLDGRDGPFPTHATPIGNNLVLEIFYVIVLHFEGKYVAKISRYQCHGQVLQPQIPRTQRIILNSCHNYCKYHAHG